MWPNWWDWELELTSHIEKRMIDRDFNEIDLRLMFEVASKLDKDVVDGRWSIQTKHQGHNWAIIVEPDYEEKVIVVITAYPIHGG